MKQFTLCILLVLAMGTLRAAGSTATAVPTMPDTAQIILFPVQDDIFGITNCYLIVGPTGQALMFDCADKLELLDTQKVIIDTVTGKSIPGSQLDKMEPVSTGARDRQRRSCGEGRAYQGICDRAADAPNLARRRGV